MSVQVERLLKQNPEIFDDVDYNEGIWVYLKPGWYCVYSDCGAIHEYTVKDVLKCARAVVQDKQRWIDENPNA